MKQLINIETVPISIQYKVTPARVETKQMMAELEIQRSRRGLSIKSRPIRLNVDSFDARNSISPSPMSSIREFGERGVQMGYEATAIIASEGSMFVDIHLKDKDPIADIAQERNLPPVPESNIKYIPDRPINMDWIPGYLQIEYEMDKLSFDWKTLRSDFNFTPARIEFVIEERPRVVITYVGDPIYVPPSADPNYKPAVDRRA